MSSSVGPRPVVSAAGSNDARIVDGGAPFIFECPGIGKKRFVSIGDWPCLAVMMMVVEPSRCWSSNASTIWPMAPSTNSISPSMLGVGSPAASV